MKTPEFWKDRGIIAELLTPLAVIYFFLLRIKSLFVKAESFSVPIICIGNATAGGAGKTPVAIAIAEILSDRKPFFVSRGYGGKMRGPIKVDSSKHKAADVGDEPLLLSRIAPCIVSKCRKSGIREAINSGAGIIILDDGLQDGSVKKDFSLLVVDGGFGFGNLMILPSGPLRDRIDLIIKKAQAAVIIGIDKNNISEVFKDKIPLLEADFIPVGNIDKTGKFIAFAGIGLPEKFFSTLKREGFDVAEEIPFADHYKFSSNDIKKLIEKAEKISAKLITTEKDFTRIPDEFRQKIMVLPVKIKWREEGKLRDLMKSKI